MFSVTCIVVAIYCIVIIYDPSLKELYSEISPDPKRCTTTMVERNITGTPEDQKCNWSSCEEWCLSKGASPCSKVRPGASLYWTGRGLHKPGDFYLVCLATLIRFGV